MRIEYQLGTEVVLDDLRMFKREKIAWEAVQKFMSFNNFLDSFGYSTILLFQEVDGKLNLLEFKGALLKFCFDFRTGLNRLIADDCLKECISGNEQGEFNFCFYFQDGELIIEIPSTERDYPFQLSSFIETFDSFYDRIVKDIEKLYPGVEKSTYWALIKV